MSYSSGTSTWERNSVCYMEFILILRLGDEFVCTMFNPTSEQHVIKTFCMTLCSFRVSTFILYFFLFFFFTCRHRKEDKNAFRSPETLSLKGMVPWTNKPSLSHQKFYHVYDKRNIHRKEALEWFLFLSHKRVFICSTSKVKDSICRGPLMLRI